MKTILLLLFYMVSVLSANAQVAITADGSAPDNSAMLHVKSTTRGILIPRLSTGHLSAISSPAKGLMMMDTTANILWFYNGTAWININAWNNSGNNIYNINTGNVGIDIKTPTRKIDVNGGAQFRLTSTKSIIFDQSASALRMYTDDYTGGAAGQDLIIGTYPNGHTNQLYLNTAGNVGIGTNAPTKKLDVNGGSQFRITGSKTLIFDQSGSALRMYTDDYAGGAVGQDLIIGTYPNGHSNQLYLNTAGNVGIGTSTPTKKLDVNGGSQFRITGSKTLIFDQSGSALRMYTDDYAGGAVGQDLIIGTYPNGHSNQLYLNTAGNVGIGTSTPTKKLDVNGGSQFRITGSKTLIFDQSGSALRMYTDDYAGGSVGQDLIIGTYPNGHSNQLYLSTSGNVGIGTNNPSQKLQVNGNICYTGSIAACSDIRYKTNILPVSNALSAILSLHPMYYNWNKELFKDKGFSDARQLGFSAQEIEALFPEIVRTDTEGYKAVDYSRLTPVLVEAVKEQQKEIDEKQKQIDVLTARLEKLERLLLKN